MSTTADKVSPAHDALIRAVAASTMRWPFRVWAFGEAVALRGLLAAARATNDREPLGFVRALLRTYVARGVGRSPEEVLRVLDGLQTDELCPCNRGVGTATLNTAAVAVAH